MQKVEIYLYWSYVVVMYIGAFIFHFKSRVEKNVARYEYFIAIVIAVWSGTSYASMALQQGVIVINDRNIYFARYIDWIVTTPLLVISIASVAMYYEQKDKLLFSKLIFADIFFIITGIIGDLSYKPINYFWYFAGLISFIILNTMLWTTVKAKAKEQGTKINRIYYRLLKILTILWIGYPVAWLLGPAGLGILGQLTDTTIFIILPIFSKVGFSLLLLIELKKVKPIKKSA